VTPVTVPGVVFVSRYDLEYAVRAERTLASAGFDVELVDSHREIGHRIEQSDEATLVVLTGGIGESQTRTLLEKVEKSAVPVAVLALGERLEPASRRRFERMGIDEVLEKPFDPDELALVARRLLLRERLVGKTHIIGRSEPIREVLERVAQYAPVHSTVLIEGESGTGKELIARAIHDLSPRATRPFIAVNCAALTDSLLESELFGHEKGAFTGATSLRKGRFEIADRGTLFLDEVGEMPHPTQVKLLRVLEEREFMRVGGSESIHVDVRVIAATNKDLGREVDEGGFRRDLYYRLAVLQIRMPPLRERREDIPLLVTHFVQEFCRENDREFVGITDDAMEVLVNYDWPGNVRELRNLVESMLVLTPGSKIRPRDIPEEIYERAHPGRLLPVALASGDEEGGEARLEAMMGWLYRDLKSELESLRRSNAEIRDLIETNDRRIDWLQAVEIEDEDEGEETSGDESGDEGAIATDNAPASEVRFEIGQSLEDLEREAIARTLEATDGNRREAARILGIGERTLYRKLKRYDLS